MGTEESPAADQDRSAGTGVLLTMLVILTAAGTVLQLAFGEGSAVWALFSSFLLALPFAAYLWLTGWRL